MTLSGVPRRRMAESWSWSSFWTAALVLRVWYCEWYSVFGSVNGVKVGGIVDGIMCIVW